VASIVLDFTPRRKPRVGGEGVVNTCRTQAKLLGVAAGGMTLLAERLFVTGKAGRGPLGLHGLGVLAVRLPIRRREAGVMAIVAEGLAFRMTQRAGVGIGRGDVAVV